MKTTPFKTMKKSLLLLAACAAMIFTSCKKDATLQVENEQIDVATTNVTDTKSEAYPVMMFDETVYDFGTIDKGILVEHVFSFTNTGNAPLVIVDAKSSCGCTIPEYSKDPIAPGDKGELLVKYNGSGTNQVTKTVTIKVNTETGKETIRIKAFVEATPQ